MYIVKWSSKFKKSFKKVKSHKNFKNDIYEKVLESLKIGKPLEPKHKDHLLIGDYIGYRECHIQNDILLIYKYEEDVLWLVLTDIGSHSELFS